jgi:ABC-2 type transport system ATP-binding protein
LIADTTVADFVAQASTREVVVRSPQAAALADTLARHGAQITAAQDGALLVHGLDAPAIGQAAADTGAVLHELSPRQASLEEAFMELTKDSVEYHTQAEAPVPATTTREA